MTVMNLLCLIATLIMFHQAIHVAARLDVHRYDGHRWRFATLAAHWAILVSGSLATTLGMEIGGPMLLIAIAMLRLTDRRSGG